MINSTIDFCGKPRKFRRQKNKVILESQKEFEDIGKNIEKIFKNPLDLENNILKLDEDITRIDRRITRLESKEENTDDEIDKILELMDKQDDYISEKRKLEKEFKSETEKKQKDLEKLNKDLIDSYAKIATLLLEPMSHEEFLEEYDSVDIIKVKKLPVYYNMALAGLTQSKINAQIKKDVEEDIKSRESSFQG